MNEDILALVPFLVFLGWALRTASKEKVRNGGNRPGPESQTSAKEWT